MRRGMIIIWLAILTCPGAATGETVPWDSLLRIVADAGRDLNKGASRPEVLAMLEVGLKDNQQSSFRPLAERLAADLRLSIQREKELARQGATVARHPERFLMETRMRGYSWRFGWNQRWLRANPEDPATLLVKEGRDAIPRLIPALRDRSPMRSQAASDLEDGVPYLPRACDMAIQLITYHSRCHWFNDATYGVGLFSARPQAAQEDAINRIKAWWAANKSKSVEQGIRAQYEQAGLYGKSWMAEQLIRLGDERMDPALRSEGIARLRELLRLRKVAIPEYVARVLARYGESALPTMMKWLQRALDEPGVFIKTDAVFYVVRHGGRESWDLILKLALREKREGVHPGHSPFLPSLANLHSPTEPRWAVPVLGLLLDRTQNTGSRHVGGDIEPYQSFSNADVATERLQKLTGEGFGYRRSDAATNRTAAIKRAQEWWQREGRAKWTLDAIDRMRAADR